jgi:hypothetical protein
MKKLGLDLGTSLLVSASIDEEKGVPLFKTQRDSFYRIVPKSEVNKNAIKMSLEKREANFIVDNDDSFIVVGEDALEIAIERNDITQRPMRRGVLSPKDARALPMLKLLIESMIGKGNVGDKVVFSVPTPPIDQSFDVVYHTELIKIYLRELGFEATPINESFAVGLSELLDQSLSGVCISWGAGLVNISVMNLGDPLVEFSIGKAGDWIDRAVGTALDLSSSIVQLEKEAGIDLFKPTSKIEEAVAVYYSSLLHYVFDNIAYELKNKRETLPRFKNPIPIVVSGGLSLAGGFVKKVETCLSKIELPIKVSEIRLAQDPLRCVANGCLLAAQL